MSEAKVNHFYFLFILTQQHMEATKLEIQASIQRESLPEDDYMQMKPERSIQRESLPENDYMQMKPERSIQRESLPEDDYMQMKPMVQRRAYVGGIGTSPDLETGIQQARGSGQPLAKSVRQPMEQAFGADFSGVKVHTDTQADQFNQSIQAKAFTTGQDVFFRQGAYELGSRGGQELLAHELTHVMQQKGRSVQRQKQNQDIQLSTKELLPIESAPADWTIQCMLTTEQNNPEQQNAPSTQLTGATQVKYLAKNLILQGVEEKTVKDLVEKILVQVRTKGEKEKIAANVSGHLYELLKWEKYVKKKYNTNEASNKADLIYIKNGETRASQIKWSTSENKRSAYKNINNVIEQLTGKKGEQPPSDARLIVDVVIQNISVKDRIKEEDLRTKLEHSKIRIN
ncbi:DUF4157 domain-containing protein [Nostoc sp. UHCC 0926]|uniref:eCIS core domain-containing protein n=1 Tax=unclassified Nostoc TaxID=2593658 RepID=UPI002360A289|nr:DUF4157 domain-containing protein [Nostoc sp. UHCC 0926]WDD31041.1 DUF4157 domain-containing protein [Nostoc sp. UHCC 0926]